LNCIAAVPSYLALPGFYLFFSSFNNFGAFSSFQLTAPSPVMRCPSTPLAVDCAVVDTDIHCLKDQHVKKKEKKKMKKKKLSTRKNQNRKEKVKC